jgi:hypothetical protein
MLLFDSPFTDEAAEAQAEEDNKNKLNHNSQKDVKNETT